MKILVLSDTHGKTEIFPRIKEQVNDIDLVIHLGDNTKDVQQLKEEFLTDVYNVKGNCDYMDDITPEEKVINIYGKKIFLTHGHNYGVYESLNNIYYRAKELDVDIVLFGHSHIPISVNHEDILLFNPGSTALPRGGSKRSFGIIEIESNVTAGIHNILKVK